MTAGGLELGVREVVMDRALQRDCVRAVRARQRTIRAVCLALGGGLFFALMRFGEPHLNIAGALVCSAIAVGGLFVGLDVVERRHVRRTLPVGAVVTLELWSRGLRFALAGQESTLEWRSLGTGADPWPSRPAGPGPDLHTGAAAQSW